jgi:hypothetical protein
MFYDRFGLRDFNQDLSKWNTQSATDMSYMFWGTWNLKKSIHFKDVSNVITMDNMFYASGVPSVKLEKT